MPSLLESTLPSSTFLISMQKMLQIFTAHSFADPPLNNFLVLEI